MVRLVLGPSRHFRPQRSRLVMSLPVGADKRGEPSKVSHHAPAPQPTLSVTALCLVQRPAHGQSKPKRMRSSSASDLESTAAISMLSGLSEEPSTGKPDQR